MLLDQRHINNEMKRNRQEEFLQVIIERKTLINTLTFLFSLLIKIEISELDIRRRQLRFSFQCIYSLAMREREICLLDKQIERKQSKRQLENEMKSNIDNRCSSNSLLLPGFFFLLLSTIFNHLFY